MEDLIRGEGGGGPRLQRYTQMLLVDAPPLVEHPVVSDLKKIDPDQLTPRDALGILYELKKRAGERKRD